jgi:hypothetical protein
VTWVAWRQQRAEALIAAGILLAVAVLLVPTGIEMASAYRHDGIASCLGAHPSLPCDDVVHSFQSRFSQISGFLAWLTLLPGLVGVLLAAPLVLQLESGGYRLDWTQSITRRRWIAVKLGYAVAAAVLLSLGFIALVTWWRTPLVHVTGRMDNSVFDSEGIVAVGYTLFALGLALAVGVVWKRAVAALMVAFVGYFAARLFVDTWLRQRLTPPASLTWPITKRDEPAALLHAWVISENPSDRLGHRVAPHLIGCERAANAKACFAAHMPPYVHAIYEPASRFWSMQAAEFGLFTAVALALIGFAAWWTARRA